MKLVFRKGIKIDKKITKNGQKVVQKLVKIDLMHHMSL
jgi:hypothetical protein